MRWGIAKTLYTFAAIVGGAIGCSGGAAYLILHEFKVGGPVYAEISSSKDLLADVLPPPAFIVEPFLAVSLLHSRTRALEESETLLEDMEAQYRTRIDHWSRSTLPDAVKGEIKDKVAPPADRFWAALSDDFLPAVKRNDAASEQAAYAAMNADFEDHRKAITDVVRSANALAASLETTTGENVRLSVLVQAAAAVGALAVLLAGVLLLRRRIVAPIGPLTEAMSRLADGRVDADARLQERNDEIGDLSAAFVKLRRISMERDRLNSEAEAGQALREIEQRDNDAINDGYVKAHEFFMAEVQRGFARLAAGDLVARLDQPFSQDYEALRALFNETVGKLEEAMSAVDGSILTIRTGLAEIATASNDLAHRTEQQAANLEETVAALSDVTGAVIHTATDAKQAQGLASSTQKQAVGGGAIVRRAVEAMASIEQSSDQIAKIIGVIDEIAFQTNLLALNAGIEAARAGEAGRGFAVVAQEVRGLAQRSAEAAKEIKDLISRSQAQVAEGVDLVSTSGRSLEEIVSESIEMTAAVDAIARRAGEQAATLQEVSAAADQMDKVTQQNAAMVEQTTAAAQTLSSETEALATMMARFTMGKGGQSRDAGASRSRSSLDSAVPQMRATGRGGAALAPDDENEWQQF